MDFQEQSEHVVAIAQAAAELMETLGPDWSRIFIRFVSDQSHFGANSSYQSGDSVFLVGALRHGDFYAKVKGHGRLLWEEMTEHGKAFKVMLLVVDHDLNFNVDFEYSDESRWLISKADGASGIPLGWNG